MAADSDPQLENRSVPVAGEGANAPDIKSALEIEMQAALNRKQAGPLPPDNSLPLALGLCALFAFGWLSFPIARFFRTRASGRAPKPASGIESFSNLLAEDEAFGNFMTAMKEGPAVKEDAAEVAPEGFAPKKSGPLEEFFEAAPKRIAMARTIFSEIARAGDAGARQKTLELVSREAAWLKDSSGMPELLPAWQTAAALEGLLKQLTRNASNVTPSALRTAAAALDLLQDLCVPGIKPNLTKKPPVRLLVVDDDAISRNAVSLALRKIFPEPQLADASEAALALAAKHAYDVIFLDVEMPGMDGFELCSKIHDTVPNHAAPVVFVTRHTDFDARAKSTLSGGEDLIGKPFLAFEITVKALTLVLRGRLQRKGAALPSAGKPRSIRCAFTEPIIPKETPAAPSTAAPSAVPPATGSLAVVPDTCHPTPDTRHPAYPDDSPRRLAAPKSDEGGSLTEAGVQNEGGTLDPSSREFADAFFKHAPDHLDSLRTQVDVLSHMSGDAASADALGSLYLGIHLLAAEAERAKLDSVSRLASALKGLLSKLLETPKNFTDSSLGAAAAAIELLSELCVPGQMPGLSEKPVSILAVDDDLLSLRAVSGGLQVLFGRPDTADTGEAALALAAEKPFDVIFMDIQMPGMGGYKACSKIHDTVPNRHTPVIFVTAHGDIECRELATLAGGSGFIQKPALASELRLTAITFALRGRLGKLKPARIAPQVEEAVS